MNNIVRIVNLQESLLNNMLDLLDLYQQKVAKYADKFIKVTLNPLELGHIVRTAEALVAAKQNETHHRKDGASEMKRFVNGLKGEGAVAKYLKMDIINPTIGVSIDFDNPDIPGYNVGVKTVAYGHFPVISKENTYPQIICICHPVVDNVIYICGLADVALLNKCQYDDLILDPNLKNKGTKTGFYGFSELKELTIDSIEPYKVITVEGGETHGS